MKVVYIAGPFTAPTPHEIEYNIRDAEYVGLEVAALGMSALVPHSVGRFAVGTFDEAYWYEATMAQLRKCDAVMMVPGWEESIGAKQERDEAIALNIPVFEILDDLKLWKELTP